MHVLIFLTGDGCIGRNAHVCDVKHGEEGLFSFQQDFGTQSPSKHNTTDAFLHLIFIIRKSKRLCSPASSSWKLMHSYKSVFAFFFFFNESEKHFAKYFSPGWDGP